MIFFIEQSQKKLMLGAPSHLAHPTRTMSTIRAYSNNKRVSTGRPMKNGAFFQAYPTHQVFASQDEWMNHWKKSSNATFVEEGYEDMPPLIPASSVRSAPTPAPASAPAPAVRPSATQTTSTTMQCCVCTGPVGTQYHGTCLMEMTRAAMNELIDEWHRSHGINVPPTAPPLVPTPSPVQVPQTPPPAPAPTSPPRLTRKGNPKPKMEDWNYEKTYSFVAPPGKYYIGDICYYLQDSFYDGIFGGHGYEPGLYTRKADNSFFMVDNTSWGDGEYNGTDGFGYGVDAGIIGIVSMPLGDESNVYGGKVHVFKEPVQIKFGNGLFRFHSNSKYLAIDTHGDSYNSDTDW
jgi:hypothetical protein